MTKAFTYSLLLIIVTLAVLLLRIPLESSLQTVFERPLISDLLAGSMVRILIIIGLSFFVIQKRLLPFNGFKPFTLSNPQLLILGIVIILLLSYSSYEFYLAAEPSVLLLFGSAQALVGIMEELLFRGIIFPLLILHFANRKHPVTKAAWLSSVLFGVVHLVGLIRHPENIWGVINTVIFAIGIGFLFACLLMRTGNILVPMFIHFLIDFTNGASALSEVQTVQSSPTSETIVLTLGVVIITSILFMGAGWFLLKRIHREEWLQKAALIRI